jgi:hypothetical protein
MATQFANKIVAMMDSKEKALGLIKRMTENLAEGSNSGEETDAALMLDDLHAAVARLEGRIKKTTGVLTGKDPGTAKSIKAAVQNEYLARRLKARAVLMRVHQKVKHSLLAAVPYRRRVSRAKKGECLQYLQLENAASLDSTQIFGFGSTPKTQLHVGFQEYVSLLGAITPFAKSSIPVGASKFAPQHHHLPPLTSISSLILRLINICGQGKGLRRMKQRLLNTYLMQRLGRGSRHCWC